jgi:hypothetical protein
MPHSGYTICTSEQRLSSTTVSHGFDIEWYSSPPFGSHGPSKHSEPSSRNFGAGDPCTADGTHLGSQRGAQGAGSHRHRELSPQRWVASRVVRSPSASFGLRPARTLHLPQLGLLRRIQCTIWVCVAFTMHFGLADSPFQPASSIDSLVRVSRRAVGGSDSPSCSIASLCHAPSGEPARPARATIRMVQPTGQPPAPQPCLCA